MKSQLTIPSIATLAALLVVSLTGCSRTEEATRPPRANDVDGLTYVWVPPGSFTLGCSSGDRECWADENPPKDITLTKGFYLGQTEVTQAAYVKVTRNDNPSAVKGDTLPVGGVHWDKADAYCRAVGGRLPTQAEWEWAARGGAKSPRHGDLDKIAWYVGNSEGVPHPVGTKEANAFGLHDMLGNTMEWVAGWYGPYSTFQSTDPKGPDGEYREARGGGWWDNARLVRATYRTNADKNDADLNMGFRCAMD